MGFVGKTHVARGAGDGDEQAAVVQQRRHGGGGADGQVRHICHVRHDEGDSAHDRRRDLTAARGGRFDRRRKTRREPTFLDQRNGDDPRPHNVCYRTARNRAEQPACHSGGRRRAGAHPSRRGQRKADKHEVNGQKFEQRAEHDEDQDRRDHRGHRAAKDTVEREPQHCHQLFAGNTRMPQEPGCHVSERAIEQHDSRHQRHHQPDRPARQFYDSDQAEHTHPDIGRVQEIETGFDLFGSTKILKNAQDQRSGGERQQRAVP